MVDQNLRDSGFEWKMQKNLKGERNFEESNLLKADI